jgi:hypothetical protein
MPGVPAMVPFFRRFHLIECFKHGVVVFGICLPDRKEVFLFPELLYSDSRLDIAEVVFKSVLHDFVVPVALFGVAVPRIFADAMEAKNLHPISQCRIVAGDHSSFAGGQILGGVKAEHDGIAGGPGHPITGADGIAAVVSANRMGGILDHK